MSATQSKLSFPVKKKPSIILRSSKPKSGFLNPPEKRHSPQMAVVISDDEEKIVTPRKKTNSNPPPSTVTPPKQRRINSDSANSPQNFSTPSTLFSKLDLEKSQLSSRKKLFDSSSRYVSARQALHSTVPSQMPARGPELETLQGFVTGHLLNDSSGSLYISGPPGTGKTAALSKTLKDLSQVQGGFKQVYVNCTSVKSAQAVYSKIATELGAKSAGRGEKANLAAVQKFLRSKREPIILVLDEIDQLDSRKQSVLYTIFEWPATSGSCLILIGIANALDLTDRILPRLQSRCELKPKLLHFAPYTKQQLVDIITTRLSDAGVLDVFSSASVQLLAGKVSAVSGDVRRALDIARRAIEIIQAEQRHENSQVVDPHLGILQEKVVQPVGSSQDKCQLNGTAIRSTEAPKKSLLGTCHAFKLVGPSENLEEPSGAQKKILGSLQEELQSMEDVEDKAKNSWRLKIQKNEKILQRHQEVPDLTDPQEQILGLLEGPKKILGSRKLQEELQSLDDSEDKAKNPSRLKRRGTVDFKDPQEKILQSVELQELLQTRQKVKGKVLEILSPQEGLQSEFAPEKNPGGRRKVPQSKQPEGKNPELPEFRKKILQPTEHQGNLPQLTDLEKPTKNLQETLSKPLETQGIPRPEAQNQEIFSGFLEKEVFKAVGVEKIVSVLNNVYGTCENLQEDMDESIPLQQKLLLCSLILILKKGKNKDVTVGKLHEVYRKVCKKRNLTAIDMSEFVGLCSLLETRGMIRVQGRKEPRFNKVCLEWDEDEVSSVLKDKQLMSSVLQDESVFAR